MPIITSKPKKHYTYKNLEFWAERGLVHILDFSKGKFTPDYKTISVRDALLRARALVLGLSRYNYTDERVRDQNFIDNIIAVCKEAKSQGRPDDPKTFEWLAKQRSDKHFALVDKDVP